jgi:hypothetical protein
MPNSDPDQAQWRHDYDQRQYRRMLERLEGFEIGRLFLSELIADLDTLLDVLEEDVDETWAGEFSELWCELEVIDACAKVRGDRVLRNKDARRAREIAGELKRIVVPKIDTGSSEAIDE